MMGIFNEYMDKVQKQRGYNEMPFGDRLTPSEKRNSKYVDKEDGSRALEYHQTEIVTVMPNGNIKLNSGGWQTQTTKDRMNNFSLYGLRVFQKDSRWYVTTMTGEKYDFADGMVFSPEGDLIEPGGRQ